MDVSLAQHLTLWILGAVAVAAAVPGGEPESDRPPNRLVGEKSPYLLEHAYNPVDWYPWGSEAFERARREDKPIFLSIGYSTCHWCHVMERESFEDPDVAALMNETFVSIKVDREERPDIDGVYMEAARLMTGRGGWPLTIIMTPDKRPFYAATYLPKTGRFGMPGMLELVPRIGELWSTRRDELTDTADRVASSVRELAVGAHEGEAGAAADPGPATLDAAYRQLSAAFDEERGGFGGAPKFPTPHQLLFLLRYWSRTGEARALEMVKKTLDEMRRGGIYDHLGYGFHRYSTDADWLLPHFEKMLYDQAMLTIAYTETYLATGDARYEMTAREILTYVLRDMAAPGGGFYSAEDADSEGVEGKFYVWTMDEVRNLLGDDADLASAAFGLSGEGNVEDEATRQRTGANVLHVVRTPAQLAQSMGGSEEDIAARLESVRLTLFAERERRVRPLRDEKILTDWNGLMIAALSRAARAFDEPVYADAARSSARFVLSNLRDDGGRLLHRYAYGESAIPANVDDYAFLVLGLHDLYEATHETRYLKEAIGLSRELLARFWDDEAGGFFFTPDDAETLLARRKEVYDGATPSGNSVAMLNLLKLSRATGDSEFEKRASDIASTFGGTLESYPAGHTMLLSALDFALSPSTEVVIVGEPGAKDTEALLSAVWRGFNPNAVTIVKLPGDDGLTAVAPWTEPLVPQDGRATAYVCRDRQCRLPTTDPSELERQLGSP